MKFKSIKYNKKGITRVENTTPKFVLPKKDLNEKNRKIIIEGNYIKIEKIEEKK